MIDSDREGEMYTVSIHGPGVDVALEVRSESDLIVAELILAKIRKELDYREGLVPGIPKDRTA